MRLESDTRQKIKRSSFEVNVVELRRVAAGGRNMRAMSNYDCSARLRKYFLRIGFGLCQGNWLPAALAIHPDKPHDKTILFRPYRLLVAL
jgi:hypothetical protein